MSRREHTGVDVHQFVGNSSLTTAIVLKLERATHITCIFGGIIHGIATINPSQVFQRKNPKDLLRAHFASISLHNDGVDGETEFRDVASHVVFHFVGNESSCEQSIRSAIQKK